MRPIIYDSRAARVIDILLTPVAVLIVLFGRRTRR